MLYMLNLRYMSRRSVDSMHSISSKEVMLYMRYMRYMSLRSTERMHGSLLD